MTRWVVRIALLDHHELGLHDLHARRGARGMRHERRQDQTNDDGQHDDRKTPVTDKALDAREHRGQEVNKPFPHGSSAPFPRGRDRILQHGRGDTVRFCAG